VGSSPPTTVGWTKLYTRHIGSILYKTLESVKGAVELSPGGRVGQDQ
jgi:hypothetical protein